MTEQTLQHKRVWATATMKPFTDYWLDTKPTKSQVLEAIASLIQLGKLDELFTVTIEEEQ